MEFEKQLVVKAILACESKVVKGKVLTSVLWSAYCELEQGEEWMGMTELSQKSNLSRYIKEVIGLPKTVINPKALTGFVWQEDIIDKLKMEVEPKVEDVTISDSVQIEQSLQEVSPADVKVADKVIEKQKWEAEVDVVDVKGLSEGCVEEIVAHKVDVSMTSVSVPVANVLSKGLDVTLPDSEVSTKNVYGNPLMYKVDDWEAISKGLIRIITTSKTGNKLTLDEISELRSYSKTKTLISFEAIDLLVHAASRIDEVSTLAFLVGFEKVPYDYDLQVTVLYNRISGGVKCVCGKDATVVINGSYNSQIVKCERCFIVFKQIKKNVQWREDK